jgi:hypothetical protein
VATEGVDCAVLPEATEEELRVCDGFVVEDVVS